MLDGWIVFDDYDCDGGGWSWVWFGSFGFYEEWEIEDGENCVSGIRMVMMWMDCWLVL